MLKARWFLGALTLATACGGESQSTSNASGAGGTRPNSGQTTSGTGAEVGGGGAAGVDEPELGGAESAGTVAFKPDHGCASDTACPPGSTCQELTAGGPRTCITTTPTPPMSCDKPSPPNACCTTADCGSGQCLTKVFYPTGLCGNGGVSTYNECRSDECTTDADCGSGQACAPAGFEEPVRACVSATCHTDADCEAGGACVWISAGCCFGPQGISGQHGATLACAYADGCQSDKDCGKGICGVENGRARCSQGCQ